MLAFDSIFDFHWILFVWFLVQMHNNLTSIPWRLPTCFSFVTGHEFQWIVCSVAYSSFFTYPFSQFIYFKMEDFFPLFGNKIISRMLTCADCSKNKNSKYKWQTRYRKSRQNFIGFTWNTEFWLKIVNQNVSQIIMWHINDNDELNYRKRESEHRSCELSSLLLLISNNGIEWLLNNNIQMIYQMHAWGKSIGILGWIHKIFAILRHSNAGSVLKHEKKSFSRLCVGVFLVIDAVLIDFHLFGYKL